MTKMKSTKRALLTSVMSLIMCVSMLMGTTFAWFTDSVTSSSNVIQSGTLNIDVEYTVDGEHWADLDGAADLFSIGLWEPGHTELIALRITNKGSLALKYAAFMNITKEDIGKTKDGRDIVLSEILTVSTLFEVGTDGGASDPGLAMVASAFSAENGVQYGQSVPFKNANVLGNDVQLNNGQVHYQLVKVDMAESVGNEANHDGVNVPAINFGINVLATQFTHEPDSFGNDYDTEATYPTPEENQPSTPTFNICTTTQLQAAMQADATNGELVINILEDMELAAGETWTPLNLDSYKGVARVIINGNGHTIKGLNDSLIGTSVFANTRAEFNDLTLVDSTVNSNDDYAGAFIAYSDHTSIIEITNCHLIGGKISSNDYAGGLVGYIAGPVTIENCSVTDSEITGGGSVGALVGMISVANGDADPKEEANILNVSVTENTITSNKNGSYRVGELVGSSNIAIVNLSDIVSESNVCSQPASTGATSGMVSTKWIGRASNTVNGNTSENITFN